jgi:hypothetical protein
MDTINLLVSKLVDAGRKPSLAQSVKRMTVNHKVGEFIRLIFYFVFSLQTLLPFVTRSIEC